MSESGGTKKVDLIGAYITQVLIPHHRQCVSLYMQGKYVPAVELQLQIIQTLYRSNKKEKD
ncbi:unnamed protein product, partial [marine sediment metagenome]